MNNLKTEILEVLNKNTETANSAGSCGELGDSYNVINSEDFSLIADELLSVTQKYVKHLEHHRDTTVGLYAFDKKLNDVFENIPNKEACQTWLESYLVAQIEYLKSIVFQISDN